MRRMLMVIQVWRVGGDWDVETELRGPFEGCEETLVRRIGWSPDGQCLVATNSRDKVACSLGYAVAVHARAGYVPDLRVWQSVL